MLEMENMGGKWVEVEDDEGKFGLSKNMLKEESQVLT